VRLGRPQTGLTPRGGFATDRSYAVLSLSPLLLCLSRAFFLFFISVNVIYVRKSLRTFLCVSGCVCVRLYVCSMITVGVWVFCIVCVAFPA